MDSSFDHHRVIWVQVRDRQVLGLIRPSWSVIFMILLDRSEILIFFGPVPVWSVDPSSQFALLRVFGHRSPYIILKEFI